MKGERRATPWTVRHLRLEERDVLVVEAGLVTVEHAEPPAGPKYAFDRERWTRRVEVYVSPTGRSVRVFVDGKEVT